MDRNKNISMNDFKTIKNIIITLFNILQLFIDFTIKSYIIFIKFYTLRDIEGGKMRIFL